MTYKTVPIAPPPGVSTNGTYAQLQGRWIDADGVRFEAGSVRPMYGWRLVAGDDTALSGYKIIRGLFAWRWIDNSRYFVMGSGDALLVKGGAITHDGIVDITPGNFVGGSEGGTGSFGYGTGPYGRGAYGSDYDGGDSQPTAPTQQAATWTFASRQGVLYALCTVDRRVLQWTPPNTGTLAIHLPNSPSRGVDCFCITQQQQILTIGSATDRTLVQWSDGADPTDWTPTLINSAGYLNLNIDGQVIACRPYGGDILVWTTTHFLRLPYYGASQGYQQTVVAENTPCMGPNAVAFHTDIIMWVGRSEFYLYDGASVINVQCEVWDWVFPDLHELQGYKITTAVLPESNTVRWFYAARPSAEINRYVEYNYVSQTWNKGEALLRTAWSNSGVYDYPLAIDADNRIYTQELRNYTSVDGRVRVMLPAIENGERETILNRVEHDLAGDGKTSYPNAQVIAYGSNNPNMELTVLNGRPLNRNGISPLRAAAKWMALEFSIFGFGEWKLGHSNIHVKAGMKRHRLLNEGAAGDPFAPQPDYTAPEFIEGPTVTDVEAYKATITWTANETHTWAIDVAGERITGDTQGVAVLTGLTPETTYNLILGIYDAVGNDTSAAIPMFTTDEDKPWLTGFVWSQVDSTTLQADFEAYGFGGTASYTFTEVSTGQTWTGTLPAEGAHTIQLTGMDPGPRKIEDEGITLTIKNDEGVNQATLATPFVCVSGTVLITDISPDWRRPTDRTLGESMLVISWKTSVSETSRMRYRIVTDDPDAPWSLWQNTSTGINHSKQIDDTPCVNDVYEFEFETPIFDNPPATGLNCARIDSPDYSEEYVTIIVEPITWSYSTPNLPENVNANFTWTFEGDDNDNARIRYRKLGDPWGGWNSKSNPSPSPFTHETGSLVRGEWYEVQIAAPSFTEDYEGNPVQIGFWTTTFQADNTGAPF